MIPAVNSSRAVPTPLREEPGNATGGAYRSGPRSATAAACLPATDGSDCAKQRRGHMSLRHSSYMPFAACFYPEYPAAQRAHAFSV